ncbi:MAG: hypothetical protein AAB073_04920, partial [Pseudomonadota bacterium]
ARNGGSSEAASVAIIYRPSGGVMTALGAFQACCRCGQGSGARCWQQSPAGSVAETVVNSETGNE